MSNEEQVQRSNLEFFKAAFLDPMSLGYEEFALTERSTVAFDFEAVEAAHWASLGARIGYFDAKDAIEIIASSKTLWRRWYNLIQREIISPEEGWANVIRRVEEGGLELNTVMFRPSPEIDLSARELELHRSTFQTFLLLTYEKILDVSSRYFIGSIGWSAREEWNARLAASADQPTDSAQAIGLGFANVLSYLEAMGSVSDSALRRSFEWSDLLANRPNMPLPTGEFIQEVRSMMSRRFNLGQTEVVSRYFALAGEFVKLAREDGPAWLDARRGVFDQVRQSVLYAGARVTDTEGLWRVFTRAIEVPVSEREVRQNERTAEGD